MPNWLERLTEDARNELTSRKNADALQNEQAKIAKKESDLRAREFENQLKTKRKEDQVFLASLESSYRPVLLLSDIKKGPWKGRGKLTINRNEFASSRTYSLSHEYPAIQEEYSSYYGDTSRAITLKTYVGISFERYDHNFKMSIFSSCQDTIDLWNSEATLEALQHGLAKETSHRMLNKELPIDFETNIRRI